ncbi:MAG TPA: aldehyde ferredoxin oxidoreductase C-terminal domain-containing protein [Candidatus Limnocylindrales bacterium]|nr:aldehyde ferredoxin oxidoreductase C-terminal domain-containing protein [Candidatus Limnocylindrales bacterium]
MKKAIAELKASRRLLAEYHYEPAKIERGYAGQTLYINLSDKTIKAKTVTQQMKDIFIGGKGFGLWYLWNAVRPDTKWNDPENEIIISSGPIGGITQYPGSGKSLVVTISPLTHSVMDSNVGGYFGPYLKFSGWDALEIQGKAEKDVCILIDGDTGKVTIEEIDIDHSASHLLSEQLTAMLAETEKDKQNVSIVSTGSGAEHTLIGLLNFSFYDRRRKMVRLKQAGRGGIGTVFRDKKLVALAVRYSSLTGRSNNPADQATITKTGVKLSREINKFDDSQFRMRQIGTANLMTAMNDYDLLPVHNFKYGSHEDGIKISSEVFRNRFTQNMPDGCWVGCALSCCKAVDGFTLKSGPFKGEKVLVDGPEYENAAGLGANCGIFDPDYIIEANFYCDTYGIDTISTGTLIAFIMECYENGILNKDITGGLEMNFGNKDAAMALIHQMGQGSGFGRIAGLGVRRMKQIFSVEYGAEFAFLQDIGMENKGLEYSQYQAKESLAQQGGYGMTNKGPQHDEAWLIFMDMVNKQLPTFEKKAEALHYFPMFRTWFGLQGLCKLPWNDIIPEGNSETESPEKIPEHVQNYVAIFNAVTGKNIDKEEMIRQSERVYNFQRVFNLRLGYGTRKHDAVPYRAVGPVTIEEYESRAKRYDHQLKEDAGINPVAMSTSDKVQAMRKYREEQYEKLVDVVYKRRGWTTNGVPKLETLQDLGIDFPEVVEVVKENL